MSSDLPTLRWGIIATGWMAGMFVDDLVLQRSNPNAKHVIQAIGSSSLEKAKKFAQEHVKETQPSVYGSYTEVYNDTSVDIVWIGTPHALHKQNCLDAINHGKPILCEKPFTVNFKEAEEVIAAAKAKGVFIMEAMWTRFFPLVRELQQAVHHDKVIGDVHRVFCDFGLDNGFANLPKGHRLKDPALGGGSLLDIGIYALTWGLLFLDDKMGESATNPVIHSAQTLVDDVDVTTSMILHYPDTRRQGVLTSTMYSRTDRVFARIEGSKGVVTIEGGAASIPEKYSLKLKEEGAKEEVHDFDKPGGGWYFQADAVAQDIIAGKKENAIMPWAETLRVMKILDGIRRQSGAKFPQDE